MDLKTLQFLREKHSKNSDFVVYTMDNIVYFYNNKDFIIFDDDNQIMHAVRANSAGNPEYINGQSPIVIKSTPYDQIFFISSGYSVNTFNDEVIESFFGDLLSEKQKQILKEFTKNLSSLQDIQYSKDKYNGVDVMKAESTIAKDIYNTPDTTTDLT